jgi:hypothetical protein
MNVIMFFRPNYAVKPFVLMLRWLMINNEQKKDSTYPSRRRKNGWRIHCYCL